MMAGAASVEVLCAGADTALALEPNGLATGVSGLRTGADAAVLAVSRPWLKCRPVALPWDLQPVT